MKELSKEDLRSTHKQSLMTKQEMKEYKTLGCFNCGNQFKPTEITEFADGDATPFCPTCFIDSVVPLDGLNQKDSQRLLKQLNNYFF